MSTEFVALSDDIYGVKELLSSCSEALLQVHRILRYPSTEGKLCKNQHAANPARAVPCYQTQTTVMTISGCLRMEMANPGSPNPIKAAKYAIAEYISKAETLSPSPQT